MRCDTVDATRERVWDLLVRVTVTKTLALPRKRLAIDKARASIGELFLAGVGAPTELYRAEELQLEIPPTLFSADSVLYGDIVRVCK